VSVPAFNASHGCLRVPIPDALRIFNWIDMGDKVIVYP
jgi:lipoprotein-anchoring transpeptidase ErfK/SrfK